MSFKAFFKRCLLQFFIITSCVTLAIALLGQALDPAARFGYEGFFSPLIFSLLSLAPSFVLYSRKELSLRQTLLRKLLHILMLEGTLILFGFWAKLLHGPADAAFFALAVLLVYLAVNLIRYLLDRKEAGEINKTLKAFQGRD